MAHAVATHTTGATLHEESFVGDAGDDEEEKSIVLDDLDDLDDTELTIYDSRQSTPSTSSAPLGSCCFDSRRKAENKLINKSSPFPLPNEFYLYTPLGKLDKCMQCKAAFTSSHMLANHIVKVHPKVSKNPKPFPRHPNASENSSIQILPTAEFQGPSAAPVKRQRGRPPRVQFGAHSGVPEETAIKRLKPNESERPTTMIPINTYDNNTNNNNYNNNSSNNSHTNTSIYHLSNRDKYVSPPIHNHPSVSHISPPPIQNTTTIATINNTPNTITTSNNSSTTLNNTNGSTIPKGLNLESLAKKIENLAMLRKVADQGLISEQQFQQKQEEFLQSVSFL